MLPSYQKSCQVPYVIMSLNHLSTGSKYYFYPNFTDSEVNTWLKEVKKVVRASGFSSLTSGIMYFFIMSLRFTFNFSVSLKSSNFCKQ